MKLFDLHCDTATECEKQHLSMLSNSLHWDGLRARSLFSSSVQVAAVFIPDIMKEEDAWSYALRVLSYIESHPFSVIRQAADFDKSVHGVMLAIENGKVIGSDLSRIKQLASFGVAYITITWNGSNRLGHGSLSGENEGLTPFGKEAVCEMLRVGILPDVSHLNETGFWDVAELSQDMPMLASHSDSMSVHRHPRNLTDEQFLCIRNSGGLVGINLCKDHLGDHSLEQIERHLVRYWELGGEGVTAMGMDLDGTPLPREWNGVEIACRLYEYLLRKGYDESLLDKLFFKNSHAFFTKTLTSAEKCIKIDK